MPSPVTSKPTFACYIHSFFTQMDIAGHDPSVLSTNGEHSENIVATPGQLVKCVAEALGLPEATVILYDRALAENGLRSKGGRGTSAARVTAVDAANLLLAIVGSPVSGSPIKSAVSTCEAYGRLPMKLGWDDDNREKCEFFGFPTLANLRAPHTLQKALAALILGASKGEELIIPNDEDESGPLIGPTNDWFTAVTLDGPEPWAQIVADVSLGEGNEIARFVFHNKKKISENKTPKPTPSGDLHQSRYVSFKTIRRIGNLLARDAQ